MTTILERPATPDLLFLWVMHRFAEVFEDRAIIKGGLALRLLDSPRATTDIDYVFVRYDSKKKLRRRIEAVLAELEGARVEVTLNSRMLRADLRVDGAAIQIEVSVAQECGAMPMATGGLARTHGQPSRIVRIMNLDLALAHKLAAWNERRLVRDLYDCFFLTARLGERPHLATLDLRLANIESKLPTVKDTKRMSRADLADALDVELAAMTQAALDKQLGPLLPPEELAGLEKRMRAAIARICEQLRT